MKKILLAIGLATSAVPYANADYDYTNGWDTLAECQTDAQYWCYTLASATCQELFESYAVSTCYVKPDSSYYFADCRFTCL